MNALILNNNLLRKVEDLKALPHLNTLVLSHNKLTKLSLEGLANLTQLSLSHNQLEALPDLTACPLLKQLRLNDNRSVDINLLPPPPQAFGFFKNQLNN